jgi:hypothetical protein
MKTGTVTIRLPVERVEKIKKMAEAKGCAVTELLKEPIENWLDGVSEPSADSVAIMQKLEQLEQTIAETRKEQGAVLIASLASSAGARYLSNLCALYADDVISYLSTQKPLDEKTKALREEQRAADEDVYANICIEAAKERANQSGQ